MFNLLEFIFQGFFEWIYSLILEAWNYFSSSLLNVMSLNFAYIKNHIPVVADISQVLLAVGWALLLGNLVFQALRGMASGLGFEAEDPKLLFARTFVFGFLLLASPQICDIVLTMTSTVITMLNVPDAISVHLVDSSVFGLLGVSWLLVIIFDVITMFMVLSLLLEVAERYVILAVLTITAPLAFAMGGSKSTAPIFAGWCRMFGSMCLLMALNIVFFKMLLSVVSAVPSFPDVFLWMVLIVSIVKAAKKADEAVTRIGLNPAITGNQTTLAGVLAHTAFRAALTIVTKGVASKVGGAAGAGAEGSAVGATATAPGGRFRYNSSQKQGTQSSNQQMKQDQYSTFRTQSDSKQTKRDQTSWTQTDHTQAQRNQQSTFQAQTSSQQETTFWDNNDRMAEPQRAGPGTRKTSVPKGTRRSPAYVTPSDSQERTEERGGSAAETARENRVRTGSFSNTSRSVYSGGLQTGSRSIDDSSSPRSSGFRSSDDRTTTTATQENKLGRSVNASQKVPRGGASGEHPQSRSSGFQDGRIERFTQGDKIGRVPSSDTVRRTDKTDTKLTAVHRSDTTSTRQPIVSAKHPDTPKGPQAVPSAGKPAHVSPQASAPARPPDSMPQPSQGGTRSAQQSGHPVRPQEISRAIISRTGTTETQTRSSQRPVLVQPRQQQTSTPGQSQVSSHTIIPQTGTAETQACSSHRSIVSESRQSRNGPSGTPPPASGTQSPRLAPQEPRQTGRRGQPAVEDKPLGPHSSTAARSRTPPAQKLSGGSAPQRPTRQIHREGGRHGQ